MALPPVQDLFAPRNFVRNVLSKSNPIYECFYSLGARHRSPTPYPMATRPAPPPPTLKPETPESQKSKKRSRDVDNDEEATRPRKRVSQESIVSSSPSVTRSGTPLSTQGSPVPRRSERRGRSGKRSQSKDDLKNN